MADSEIEREDLRDADLAAVLEVFYERVEDDELLAPYFADLDMREHMPRIEAFWSTILFRTQRYRENAFAPHLEMPGLTAAHFQRWVETLETVVAERFAGAAADQMLETAHRIAYSMQLRLGIHPFQPYRASVPKFDPEP